MLIWPGPVRLRPTRPYRRRRRQRRFIADVGGHDGGYFAREGVPTELIYIRGGPQTMSALVSGEVPFAQIYGGALVAAGLTGVDTVIVAGLINSPFFSIITTKGIDKPDDLRGKKIGISTFGSATDFALRLALKKWGLKADSEVSILQMRGVPEILPAMASGALHGGVMSPPTNMMAIRAGFKELAYLPQIGISFQHTTVATTRRYLEKNRPVALKVMRAYIAAIERIKADKAFTLKTLSKYMSTNDTVVLDYSYNVAPAAVSKRRLTRRWKAFRSRSTSWRERAQGKAVSAERFRRYFFVGGNRKRWRRRSVTVDRAGVPET